MRFSIGASLGPLRVSQSLGVPRVGGGGMIQGWCDLLDLFCERRDHLDHLGRTPSEQRRGIADANRRIALLHKDSRWHTVDPDGTVHRIEPTIETARAEIAARDAAARYRIRRVQES